MLLLLGGAGLAITLTCLVPETLELLPFWSVTSPDNVIVIVPIAVALQVTLKDLLAFKAFPVASASKIEQPLTGPVELTWMFQAAAAVTLAVTVKLSPTYTVLLVEILAPAAYTLVVNANTAIVINDIKNILIFLILPLHLIQLA